MADVTLTYKGSTIAELSASGSKTIETAGKFCDADIGLQYVKPSGGASVASGTYTASDQTRVTTVQFDTGIDFNHFVLVAEQNPYGVAGTRTFGGCFFDNTMSSKKTMLWVSSNSGGTTAQAGVLNNNGTKNGTVFALTGDTSAAVFPAGVTYRWYAW